MRRVVITGMGIVSSIGGNQAEVLDSLWHARSGIDTDKDHVDHGFRSHVSGIPKVDWEADIDRRTRRFMVAGTGWNYLALNEAIKEAGLSPHEVSSDRTGIVMGSGGPSTQTLMQAIQATEAKGPKAVGPLAVPKAMSSSHSAVLAVTHKIRGFNYSISSACATSAHCVGNAYELIQLGKQDIVFAGGGESVHWSLSVLFDAMGALTSQHNDEPVTASRAYDVSRDGFVIAGGAGVLVMEDREHALARGAKILAEIVGYGVSSDGGDMVAPSGEGAVRCMKMALEGVGPGVDYINTHGTSTPIGDVKEIEAINEVFGVDNVPDISSTKSLTGHSLGGTGVQEAIYSIMMMNKGFLCESAHITNLDPVFKDTPILRARKENTNTGIVMSNSFGFGGTNATLVFQHPDI